MKIAFFLTARYGFYKKAEGIGVLCMNPRHATRYPSLQATKEALPDMLSLLQGLGVPDRYIGVNVELTKGEATRCFHAGACEDAEQSTITELVNHTLYHWDNYQSKQDHVASLTLTPDPTLRKIELAYIIRVSGHGFYARQETPHYTDDPKYATGFFDLPAPLVERLQRSYGEEVVIHIRATVGEQIHLSTGLELYHITTESIGRMYREVIDKINQTDLTV